MNVVKCINGHFFDSDTYNVCPHCGAAILVVSAKNESSKTKKKKKKKAFVSEQINSEIQHQAVNNSSLYVNNFTDNGNIHKMRSDSQSYEGSNKVEDHSSGVHDLYKNQDIHEETADSVESCKEDLNYNGATVSLYDVADTNNNVNSVKNEEMCDNKRFSDLCESNDNFHSDNADNLVTMDIDSTDGETVGYFNVSMSPDGSSKKVTVDPVVGWLVCINGNHFGESFNIVAGVNSIGRSWSNKIVLEKDNAVSREKHAMITYEPKHRQFYIKPGDGRGLTYVNDSFITETGLLNSHDIIEIGASKLILIPLCGDNFTWDDYIDME